MKKKFLVVILAVILAAAGPAAADCLVSIKTVVTNETFTAVSWNVTNSAIIQAQLLAITNTAGETVFPTNTFNRPRSLVIRSGNYTNGTTTISCAVR